MDRWKKRPIGRPSQSLRIFLLNDIKKIIPNIDNLGSFHTWANFASCDLTWFMLIHRLGIGNTHNEEWKEKFHQNDQLPKDDNYSSPNKASSPNTAPSPSNNNTPLSPQISPSKNKSELFEVLDLQISASSIECKKAYKKLARNYHPDKW